MGRGLGELSAPNNEFAKVHPIKKAMRTKAFPLLVLFVLMVVFFSIFPQLYVGPHAQFLGMRTFWRILEALSVTGLLTIGAGLLIVSGGIDLSTGAVGSFAGVILATGISNRGWSWWAVILVAIAGCALIGLINAIIINELKLPAFVATMAMSTAIPAISLVLSANHVGTFMGQVNFRNSTLETIGRHRIGDANTAALVVLLLFIIYGVILAKTKFGRTLYLMGGNRAAARLVGINEKKISYFLFINCAVLAGLAGLLNAMRVGIGGAQVLVGEQFTGITAAILGGISFGGGSGGLGGAFMGLVVIRTFAQGTAVSGASAYLTQPASGALLLLALAFDYFNTRRQRKRLGI